MAYDLTEISRGLLALALEEEVITSFAEKAANYIVEIEDFCHEPYCVLLQIHPQKRKVHPLACVGCTPEQVDAIRQMSNPDCPFFIAARSGETTVLNREACSADCACDCRNNLHIVPFRKGNNTIAEMIVSLSETGSPNEDQLQVLQVISGILSKSIARLLFVEQQERMALLVHENPNPILECDEAGEVTYANPAVKKILWQHSIDQDELLPTNHIEYVRSAARLQTPETVKHDVGESSYSWTYQHDAESERTVIYGIDISDQKRIETQLAHDAMHDALTGLPNRNQLFTILKSEFSVIKRRKDYSFALLLIDLDRFKTVIESLGFEAGNVVLSEIASRLRNWRGHDKVVARLGGDEFAIILEDLSNISRVVELANNIKRLIVEPFRVNENSISLTVSIGIAIGNSLAQTPEGILQNASAAVYRAKRQGTNNTEVFDKEMHLNALARLQVHNELADAMASGDLTVYYQPVLGLNDLRVRGFEALARWQHPKKGLLLPGQFIPIAEETGLINELGALVIKTVCRQLAAWKSAHFPLAWVSVNVSAHQFKLDHLVSDIMRYIVEAGADPSRLFVEITEGTAAEHPERAFEMMTKLKEHGIRIALDDFGTGYSSMSYLKRFPIDTLKLDRTFIMGLPENQDDAAIATTVINMAKSLGMKVVAEGVEDERQAMFLRLQKCDEVQGFLYGKPMPERNATLLLKAGARAKKESNPLERIHITK
ncbi:MAG: EAL domain-containing protein [Deltaproteobacteria bacterium]|nr:EAL domain-containing protein [Deltaproteobacteria bacterium]MBN2670541.1 EAL domain-containing protein [Deltaproteobacteria bacterium]